MFANLLCGPQHCFFYFAREQKSLVTPVIQYRSGTQTRGRDPFEGPQVFKKGRKTLTLRKIYDLFD